jgi:hypothetical protein
MSGAVAPEFDPGCGRPLNHRRLLVHGLHFLRESRRDDRARSDRQLFGDRARRRADVHRRAIVRSVGRPRPDALVPRGVGCARAAGRVGNLANASERLISIIVEI